MRQGFHLGATLLGMVLIASGTYLGLGSLTTRSAPVLRPAQTQAVFTLPGTIFVVQRGEVYRISKGTITRVDLPRATTWSQPAVSPDGSRLVLVGGDSRHSELFLLTGRGEIQRRLTQNDGSALDQNHWAFFPRFSSDGGRIFYSWDPKDPVKNFRVDLAVYSLGLTGEAPPGLAWTVPDPYTGGDIAPQALPSGGLLYSGYSLSPDQQVQSRIWMQAGPGVPGKPLTDLAANCGRPALSPAGDQLAMICSPTAETAVLNVAPFHEGVIGAPTITIADQLVSAPAWAPDGGSLLYLAAPTGGTGFDLWWLPLTASTPGATPGAAGPAPGSGRRQVTLGLDLDTASTPAWGLG